MPYHRHGSSSILLALLLYFSLSKVTGITFARGLHLICKLRGGEQEINAPESWNVKREKSLDEKVRDAMKKLGLGHELVGDTSDQCEDGVCPLPTEEPVSITEQSELVYDMAKRIASEMGVNEDLALAALGATAEHTENGSRKMDESAAKSLIQNELELIGKIPVDCAEVQQLVSEGHEIFLARRALAFVDGDMDNARAILIADQMDAEIEQQQREESSYPEAENDKMEMDPRLNVNEKKSEGISTPVMKSLKVESNFDPVSSAISETQDKPQLPFGNFNKKIEKKDVVFDITTDQIQEIVLNSPVPVLLDCYAPWCGPCKAITPILEEIAVKGAGAFRLVKINTDNERQAATALEITALPTIFAIRDGKLLNSFQGMPSGEEMMKNFLMGLLMPGATFNPPVTAEAKEKFAELSSRLTKVAGTASFPFSARERLQIRVAAQLDALVNSHNGNMANAEESAMLVRTLLSSLIRDPYSMKYRRINLENKKIAEKVGAYPPCIMILKNVGFSPDIGGKYLIAGSDKKVLNVSPFSVARDCIDKWIDRNRSKIAADLRRRKDEEERLKLSIELEDEIEVDEEGKEDIEDPSMIALKVRIEGKKKVHDIVINPNESLQSILDTLPFSIPSNFQITCVAKKLVVKSDDVTTLSKSIASLGLKKGAVLVIKTEGNEKADPGSKLNERAASKKRLKRGSHSMHSIGIYAKDDNVKGNLVDGGGGVMYEMEVSDDESEEGAKMDAEEDTEK
jgi:thioredoxin 1